MSENEKVKVPKLASSVQRSKTLRGITIVSGLGTVGVGLLYVLTGSARAIDIVLVAGGLVVVLAGFVLMRRRNPAS